jgi:predicted nucleic acid-binding Zn ribbon protein
VTQSRVVYIRRRLVLTPRTCAQCGTAFEGWGRQRFCSKACQRRWDYRRHAEQRRAARRERYRRDREQGQA